MSAHRQHYFEANLGRDFGDFAPERKRRERRHENVGSVIAIVILAVVCLGAAGNYLRERHQAAQPVVTPVPMPVITSVEEARAEGRIEGYRAGFEAAQAQGCRAATLSRPLL